MKKIRMHLTLALGAFLALESGASAHAILEFPAPRPGSNPGNTVGPCGPAPSNTASTPTVLQAGSTVTVTWEETIHHAGNYQFYLAPLAQQGSLPMGIPSPVPTASLIYSVAQTFNNSNNLPHQYSAQITLPNQLCNDCVLQMYQVNSDVAGGATFPPANATNVIYYFSCADIQLVATAPSPAPSATPSTAPSPAPSPVQTACPTTPATFANVNSMIIQPLCISCHSSATISNANTSLATYADVLNTVNLTDPSQSLIYQLTEEGPAGGGMPLTGPALTPAQESLILNWIKAGAPNN